MFPNAKGSELISVLATVDPVSQSAGTVTTGWIFAGNHHNLMALLQTGTMSASSTLDAKLQQAMDSSGTSTKDISGKAITQITQAASGSNKQAIINLRTDDLDLLNGFSYVRLSITVGTAASLAAAQVLGVNPRFASADGNNQAAVVQIV